MERQYQSPVQSFSFRDKTGGWMRFRVNIEFRQKTTYSVEFGQDEFMRGFLSNVSLRPSCYSCFCNNFRSGSDITLADYWGITQVHPEFSDDRGTSLVLVHTLKGNEFWQRIQPHMVWLPSDLAKAVKHNPCIVCSVGVHPKRKEFFDRLGTAAVRELITDILKPDHSLTGRIKRFVRRLIVNRFSKYVYRKLTAYR
jgi:hypothetical protein